MFQKYLILTITLIFVNSVSAESINVEKIVQNVCVACHAVDGNSIIAANPKLSAQHQSYLYKQLMNYKSGERDNGVMAGIVANLYEDEMKSLSEYFSKQDLKLSTLFVSQYSKEKAMRFGKPSEAFAIISVFKATRDNDREPSP